MALVLYDNPVSSNALKVRFLLAELGVAHERVEVPMARPRPDWYLALNPLGGIPALRDGDMVLAESAAILRYLVAREGAWHLYPPDPPARARIDEWIDRFVLTLRPALRRVENEALGWTPGGGFGSRPPDHAAAVRVAGEVAPVLAVFDALLAGPLALGPDLTLADVVAAPPLFRTTVTGMDLAPFPRLRAWRDALVGRPAFRAAGPVR
ncbi:MAG: glutathione S-transferase family protein [Thermoleophilia bacterium]|jgi:glutathione S-transferase|nr:glutathione S-transferase family protein [Thermoleophilia bacterium]